MLNEGFREATTPLMRPNQVEKMGNEKRQIEAILSQPNHVLSAISNLGDLRRHLQAIDRDVTAQAPTQYSAENVDSAVRRESQLREEMLQGFPTQKEMRLNPAGATDKHMAWEKRNKKKLLEWKNIRLRLHAGGALNEVWNATDVANFERFRPVDSPTELNMHNTQVKPTNYHLPNPGSSQAVVMNDDQAATLKNVEPEIFDRMATLSVEERSKVLSLIDALEISKQTEVNKTPVIPDSEKKYSSSKAAPISEAERVRRQKAGLRFKSMHKAKRDAKLLAKAQEV